MDRRNWLLSAGGVLVSAYVPTKTYSFLFDNPLRDDSLWLSQQDFIPNGEYYIRSYCTLKENAVIEEGKFFLSKTAALAWRKSNKIRAKLFGINNKNSYTSLIKKAPAIDAEYTYFNNL